MRFRTDIQLGYQMNQVLGSLALPTVARDEVKRKGAKAILGASRAAGKAQSLREAVERLDERTRTCALCGAFPAERGHACTVDDSSRGELIITGTPPHEEYDMREEPSALLCVRIDGMYVPEEEL